MTTPDKTMIPKKEPNVDIPQIHHEPTRFRTHPNIDLKIDSGTDAKADAKTSIRTDTKTGVKTNNDAQSRQKKKPHPRTDRTLRKTDHLLAKKPNQTMKLVLMLILLALAIFFFKRQSLFLIFAGIAGYIRFIQTKWNWPIDLSPIFFFTMLIGTYYGLVEAILFLTIADAIPILLGGGVIEFVNITTYVLMLVLAMISSIFPESIVFLGIVLSIVSVVGSSVLNKMADNLNSLTILNIGLNLFLNVAYFLKIAPLIVPMIQ